MDDAPVCEVVGDETGIFVWMDGVRIAKRGHLGTPQAGMWISEPGWVVKSVQNTWGHSEIVVEHNGVRVH